MSFKNRLKKRTNARDWFFTDRLHGKQERRRARRDLKSGIEPALRYTTGKHPND